MRITAFSLNAHHYKVMAELYGKLKYKFWDDVDLVSGCLCNTKNLNGLEVIVAHPEYTNEDGCWSRIKNLIETNPNIQFYLFAITAPGRKDFFGEKPNLIYIDDSNLYAICEDAPAYFEKNKLR